MRHKSATVGAKVDCADCVLSPLSVRSRFLRSEEAEGIAERQAGKHGLHPNFGPVLRNHKEYDLMFEDIRNKLKAVPGEPVNLDHLLKDGF